MQIVGLIGLLKIELPAHTVLLCDGGFMPWPDQGETYRSSDPVFGSIGSVDALTEGMAESVPALDLSLLPPETSAAADLSQPGFQRSRVRFWLAEFSPHDGILIGDPEPMFDGQIDQTSLTEDRNQRSVELTVVSNLERLFTRNRGNSFNPRWHKSVWPGETGHDNATGLPVPVAWGAESPASGGSARGGSSGGGGGGYARGFDLPGPVYAA